MGWEIGGRVKKSFFVALSLCLSGCSGFDKHLGDTLFPLGNPNSPSGQSELMRRVKGEAVTNTPIAPEPGDVWPGQPEAVPTLQDVSHSDSRFTHQLHRSLDTLNADLKHQLHDGQAVAAGESVATHYGVGPQVRSIGKPLPSHVHDNAPLYLKPIERGTVSIPNGDGTVTLIAPNGSIRIISVRVSKLLAKRQRAMAALKRKRHLKALEKVLSSEDGGDRVEAAPRTSARAHTRRRRHVAKSSVDDTQLPPPAQSEQLDEGN